MAATAVARVGCSFGDDGGDASAEDEGEAGSVRAKAAALTVSAQRGRRR